MGNTNNRQNAAIIAVDARTLLQVCLILLLLKCLVIFFQNDLPKFICQDRLGNFKFQVVFCSSSYKSRKWKIYEVIFDEN